MTLKTIITSLLSNDDYSRLITKDLKEFLTERQCLVVKLKQQGYKNIEIAKKIGYCPATITKELKIIKEKVKNYLRRG